MNTDKSEVIDISCILSCLCPLSFSKVQHAVRGKYCHHLRFFDRDSFVELYKTDKKGPCPICMKPIRFDELVEDTYIQSLINQTAEDDENITLTQEYSFDPSVYSGYSEEDQIETTTGHTTNRHLSQASHLVQRYKTEDNHYIPIPQDSYSLSEAFFYKRIQRERQERIQHILEQKYWEYLDFYMHLISKAIHLQTIEHSRNPFILFHNVNIQQINAIQEIVDTVDAYCLSVGNTMLVVIDDQYYPDDDTENELVDRHLTFEDYISARMKSVF